ncbi:MAG: hypothetical protein MMC33_005024 [Icmadophila ericetorum]|nr:hypothetical protein [Icmadophila ericetorum]
MTLSLTEADAPAFEFLIVWVYQGEDALWVPDTTNLHDYVRLYLLADLWCLVELMEVILDIFYDSFQSNDVTEDPRKYMNTVADVVLEFTAELIRVCKRLSLDSWAETISRICAQRPDFAAALLVHKRPNASGKFPRVKVSLVTWEKKRLIAKLFDREDLKNTMRDLVRDKKPKVEFRLELISEDMWLKLFRYTQAQGESTHSPPQSLQHLRRDGYHYQSFIFQLSEMIPPDLQPFGPPPATGSGYEYPPYQALHWRSAPPFRMPPPSSSRTHPRPVAMYTSPWSAPPQSSSSYPPSLSPNHPRLPPLPTYAPGARGLPSIPHPPPWEVCPQQVTSSWDMSPSSRETSTMPQTMHQPAQDNYSNAATTSWSTPRTRSIMSSADWDPPSAGPIHDKIETFGIAWEPTTSRRPNPQGLYTGAANPNMHGASGTNSGACVGSLHSSMAAARNETVLDRSQPVYGINTGYGFSAGRPAICIAEVASNMPARFPNPPEPATEEPASACTHSPEVTLATHQASRVPAPTAKTDSKAGSRDEAISPMSNNASRWFLSPSNVARSQTPILSPQTPTRHVGQSSRVYDSPYSPTSPEPGTMSSVWSPKGPSDVYPESESMRSSPYSPSSPPPRFPTKLPRPSAPLSNNESRAHPKKDVISDLIRRLNAVEAKTTSPPSPTGLTWRPLEQIRPELTKSSAISAPATDHPLHTIEDLIRMINPIATNPAPNAKLSYEDHARMLNSVLVAEASAKSSVSGTSVPINTPGTTATGSSFGKQSVMDPFETTTTGTKLGRLGFEKPFSTATLGSSFKKSMFETAPGNTAPGFSFAKSKAIDVPGISATKFKFERLALENTSGATTTADSPVQQECRNEENLKGKVVTAFSVEEYAAMLSSGPVQICIENKKYYPHKALICGVVPHFAGAYKVQLADDGAVLTFPNMSHPEVFEVFLSWLYKGEAGLTYGKKNAVIIYVKLYILASEWKSPDLMDSILTILAEKSNAKGSGDALGTLKSIEYLLGKPDYEVGKWPRLDDCLVKLTIAMIENSKQGNDSWQELVNSILGRPHESFAAKIALAYVMGPTARVSTTSPTPMISTPSMTALHKNSKRKADVVKFVREIPQSQKRTAMDTVHAMSLRDLPGDIGIVDDLLDIRLDELSYEAWGRLCAALEVVLDDIAHDKAGSEKDIWIE